jgi:hypothetical protein
MVGHAGVREWCTGSPRSRAYRSTLTIDVRARLAEPLLCRDGDGPRSAVRRWSRLASRSKHGLPAIAEDTWLVGEGVPWHNAECKRKFLATCIAPAI